MQFLKSITLFSISVISILLNALWQLVVFLIDLIDGGDDTYEEDDMSPVPYNYRTGDIDPAKRLDGIYEDK